MWNNYITLLAIAALLRADYEMRRPPEEASPPAAAQSRSEDMLAAKWRDWAAKAVRRYAEAQEKKWRNWNQAMFEVK
ncbi:hypothetical protein DEALK_06960 [Dehalogenimonas alkenigignens]|uniref:Uncharacterized protein n=1 Tax=Dehalogenimonas alkenigignens TaxID=1217799 RepID=A0A0W0GH30_9CHLR|nr:hypothetical protein [Dehalogenimonas alkenigignens]KTB47851.1 hypothetical protein DEALK_06960 [Dehalogenimonas alkenigignens]